MRRTWPAFWISRSFLETYRKVIKFQGEISNFTAERLNTQHQYFLEQVRFRRRAFSSKHFCLLHNLQFYIAVMLISTSIIVYRQSRSEGHHYKLHDQGDSFKGRLIMDLKQPLGWGYFVRFPFMPGTAKYFHFLFVPQMWCYSSAKLRNVEHAKICVIRGESVAILRIWGEDYIRNQ